MASRNSIIINGTDGQVPISSSSGTPQYASIGAGTGISIASGSNTLTISSTGGGLSWTDVTGTSQAMAVNNGYVSDNAGLVTLTLPSSAAFGSTMEIRGFGAGGWTMAQNSGQTCHVGSVNTTTGATGTISSTNRYDVIQIVCVKTDTDFSVNVKQGNVTIV